MPWGRRYFAVQAVAGALWWIAVAASPFVRTVTLGSLDPIPIAALDIPLFVLASGAAALGVRWAAWVATSWTVFVAAALAVYATVSTEAGWGVLAMVAAAGGSVAALCLLVLGCLPTELIASGPFRFRLARPRQTSASHLAATFAQIVVFWGFFLAVAPVAIATLEARWRVGVPFPPFAGVVGVAVLVLASALGIWAAIAMATLGNGTPLPAAMPNALVIVGPYRFVRNPMAVSGIAQGAAVGLMLSSWLVVAYAILGSLLWNSAVRPLEEADLERRFGDEFRRYRDAVLCWVPRLQGHPPTGGGAGSSTRPLSVRPEHGSMAP